LETSMETMNIFSPEIQNHWVAIKPMFSVQNEQEYDQAVERLNNLIDWVGTNEQHPLYDLLDMLGMVVQAYDEKHYPMPESSGTDMLKFFMQEHGLTDSDLPEIGSFEIVSDIFNDNSILNANKIKALHQKKTCFTSRVYLAISLHYMIVCRGNPLWLPKS